MAAPKKTVAKRGAAKATATKKRTNSARKTATPKAKRAKQGGEGCDTDDKMGLDDDKSFEQRHNLTKSGFR